VAWQRLLLALQWTKTDSEVEVPASDAGGAAAAADDVVAVVNMTGATLGRVLRLAQVMSQSAEKRTHCR